MAELKFKMTCTSRWIDVEADGQECHICGDACYLFPPKTLEVTVQPGNHVFKMEPVVCASCFDAAEAGG